MTAKLLKQTKITILLCLNAVVVLIVGVMIVGAINMNGGIGFKVVAERSDVVDTVVEQLSLIDPVSDKLDAPLPAEEEADKNTSSGVGDKLGTAAVGNNASSSAPVIDYGTGGSDSSGGSGGGAVPRGELWSEQAITIYQTADFDICVGDGLGDLGEMYWQTGDASVIAGFATGARTWLGYDNAKCKYPVIVGTGTTTITAGTFDGSRRDTLTVTVIAPPIEQWKRDVLSLVNAERQKAGLGALAWGSTCEGAANVRAREIMSVYSHTRSDGSAWSTTCPIPASGGMSGENLNAGNAAVSPSTVVASWMNSPEHRSNILNPNFTHVSVGFIFDPNSPYKTYWSQYFTTY